MLAECGYISVTRQRGAEGRQAANRYRLIPECQTDTLAGFQSANLSVPECRSDTRSTNEEEEVTDAGDLCGKHCGFGMWIRRGETCSTCGWTRK